ncbi:MAG: ArsC family transcriptional regulator [Candidatus Delongbacteria bacterium]|nr:ArsC family transcriptional regulator [Candidatus Delongbacteria bacterium]MCG2760226.1 ArsC family transcriptional regulator [Candidatus Delongbacteria bacterium]
MNIQIFGRKKSSSTKKAERFFSERRIKYHLVDLDEKPVSRGEMEAIYSGMDIKEDLIDKESKLYKSKYAYLKFDIFEELSSNQEMLRLPIVRNGKKVTAGDQPEVWKKMIDVEK